MKSEGYLNNTSIQLDGHRVRASICVYSGDYITKLDDVIKKGAITRHLSISAAIPSSDKIESQMEHITRFLTAKSVAECKGIAGSWG